MKNLKLFFTVLLLLILNSIKIYSQGILKDELNIETIITGLLQPEGPVWLENFGLLFSDIKANKIYKWNEGNGMETYLSHSDSTNGLTYDLEGRLLAGQMGFRRIVRFEEDGTQAALADRYDGKKFNSPNDLVVKSDGSIFFTDPDFNIPPGQSKELSFNGIYRISPTGDIQLLDELTLPNGICFSPDETKLYVNDSQAHEIYVWDVVDDTTIANKKKFYSIPTSGYADGMKIDSAGNIYCTCSKSIWVVSPEGELLREIQLPSNTSNCAWGDSTYSTLYVTGGTSVLKITLVTTGVETSHSNLIDNYKLFQNYPNPFNPSTKIMYSIPVNSKVELKVFDSMGKEVAEIENINKNAGTYEVVFNAGNLASGVYYYRLNANNFTSTKKFVLIK